ncbi:uncharacterized protein LOC135093464 [Scylla paramamosain]|uniref:uncharacterized protein LOC135093464 n=1 Tax=Scylla paramamosain TaxID=85552 RepID=UPI003083D9C7
MLAATITSHHHTTQTLSSSRYSRSGPYTTVAPQAAPGNTGDPGGSCEPPERGGEGGPREEGQEQAAARDYDLTTHICPPTSCPYLHPPDPQQVPHQALPQNKPRRPLEVMETEPHIPQYISHINPKNFPQTPDTETLLRTPKTLKTPQDTPRDTQKHPQSPRDPTVLSPLECHPPATSEPSGAPTELHSPPSETTRATQSPRRPPTAPDNPPETSTTPLHHLSGRAAPREMDNPNHTLPHCYTLARFSHTSHTQTTPTTPQEHTQRGTNTLFQ